MTGAGGRVGASLVLAVVTFACAEDSVFIAYPDLPASTQGLILIPRSSQNLFAMEQLDAVELPLAEIEPELLLLGYEAPLLDLGLAPGVLSANEACRSCALLEPSVALHREAEHEWRDLDASVPDWGRAALMVDHAERCSGCPSFLSERIPVPGASDVSLLKIVRWDDESVLVRDEETQRFFRVSSSGEISTACATSTDLDVRAEFRGDDSDLWLVDASGVVLRMDLDGLDPGVPCRAATSTFTPALGAVVRALHVSSASGRPIFHALVAPSGRVGGPAFLHRFADGAWRLVHTFAETGGVATIAVAPDETMYAAVGGNELLTIRGEDLTTWTPVDVAIPFEFTVVAHLPAFGVLTASRLRGLLRPAQDEAWVALDDRNLASLGAERFGSLVPQGAGVLLANYQGGVHYYSPQTGYCDQVGLFGRASGRTLTQLPSGIMFSGESELYRGWPRPDACER